MKKIFKIWLLFWGRKYFITYVDWLKDDEVLVYKHRIYMLERKKE